MKFGKRLKRQIEQSLPEWRDKYLSYKELKKLVKLISSAPKATTSGRDSKFMHLLNDEIDKFNAFFMEQEEDFVIRHKELAYRIEKAIEQKQEMPAQIRTEMVNFHGEMVLLINYSNINYTGLAKILKKFDKRTGRVLRLRVIERVLEQPFFKTELISKLVKECEATMESVFPAAPLIKGVGGMKAAAGRQGIFGNTVAALVTMQEMRKGSSTYSHFSLPPLNLPDFDIQSLQLHSYPHTHTLIT